MSDFDLEHALRERGALLRGHFRLSSGRHSDRFIQKFRILESPPLVEAVAKEIARAFVDAKPTIVVSAAVGGIVLGYEVARQLGTDAIFVEKENGAATLRRSFNLSPDDRALVVEDVVTTGLSVREVIEVVRGYGAQVAGVGVIV
ncbi:MAG TPA: orotate phosphoribosyltransferase, partial [Candidatus Aquilonibacter sp.]